MTRNKFGYPFIFDHVRRQDKRRLDNLDYMIKNCPNDFKKSGRKKGKNFNKTYMKEIKALIKEELTSDEEKHSSAKES